MTRRAQSTKWKAEVFGRYYRGEYLVVDLMFRDDPKWQWTWYDGRPGEGRAHTRALAQRDAERAVDAVRLDHGG